ncbi:MAG: amidohydrolase family protein [candidate division Zixibacteria bacterium]|nr:amidohydrolase family protein [candidate division Zixibacteria bacterium]
MKQYVAIAAALASIITSLGVLQAAVPTPGAPQDHPIALVGGTVHPVDKPDIPGGTLLFERGKITAVGPTATLPPNTEKIDVTGKQVYPGLIDANTSLGLTEIGAVRASNDINETGSINPNVKAEVAINPESEQIPVTRSNGVTLALSAPGGGVICGTSALIQLDGWTWEDMTVKAPVGMHVKWPRMTTITAWWMQDSEDKQKENRDKALKDVRDAFDQARAYMTAKKGAAPGTPALENDSRWEAMISVLEGRLPIIVDADEIQQIEAAVAFAEAEHVKLIIDGGYDAVACAALLKKDDVPVLIGGIHRTPQREDDPYDAAYTLPDRLRRAGVRYCITGKGAVFNGDVRNLPYHAATAAAYGLPKDDALKSITLYPAQILGADDRVGSLAVGKDATVIVTDGDILEIPTHVEMEFIQGRKVDLTDKQKTLWEKYKEKYRRLGIKN